MTYNMTQEQVQLQLIQLNKTRKELVDFNAKRLADMDKQINLLKEIDTAITAKG